MTSTYAGCGCTALTPSYGKPTFVPSRPRGYGAEPAPEKGSRAGEITLILLGGSLFIYAVHTLAGGFAPPPAYGLSKGARRTR